MTTPAEANKPFLDDLDKEMTIEGILSAFSVAAAGVLLDHILGAKHPSGLMRDLQTQSQVSSLHAEPDLSSLYSSSICSAPSLRGSTAKISFAVTCEMRELSLPDDTSRIADALAIGNSWGLWNSYKFGFSFIDVSAAEAAFALLRARWQQLEPHKTIAGSLFLVTAIVNVVPSRI